MSAILHDLIDTVQEVDALRQFLGQVADTEHRFGGVAALLKYGRHFEQCADATRRIAHDAIRTMLRETHRSTAYARRCAAASIRDTQKVMHSAAADDQERPVSCPIFDRTPKRGFDRNATSTRIRPR
jgi:histidinol dehydrogenase